MDDLDLKIPPAKIHGGADHVVLALKTRNALARMSYDLKLGRELMEKAGLVTVALVTAENRNCSMSAMRLQSEAYWRTRQQVQPPLRLRGTCAT